LREVRDQYPGIDPARLTHELVRRLIGRLIEDVVGESVRRLGAVAPTSADEVRAAGTPMVGFSPLMASADRAIKEFLWTNMYRHPRVVGVMEDAEGRGARTLRALLRAGRRICRANGRRASMPPTRRRVRAASRISSPE
jgi:dGTP triphosphohydrolase